MRLCNKEQSGLHPTMLKHSGFRCGKFINEFMHIEGDDTEMVSRRILIEKYKDIKRFVDIASKYGDDLIIKGVNYEFPACSLMSVMSLIDLSDSVRIMFPEEYIEDIKIDFAEWLCEV